MQEIEYSIQNLLESGKSFYAFHLPQNDFITIAEAAQVKPFNFSALNNRHLEESFVCYPFDDRETSGQHFIPAEIKHFRYVPAADINDIASLLGNDRDGQLTNIGIPDPSDPDFMEYTAQFTSMLEALEHGEVKKVILSRSIRIEQHLIPTAAEIFIQLTRKYPDAFVYLISSPTTGIWMGASPELLLKRQVDLFSTVSLAGTRFPTHSMSEWTTKETEEQALVSYYIDNILYSFNINDFDKAGPEVIRAGNVVHLKTTYKFRWSEDPDVAQFVEALHPTPALCGEPKQAALDLIRNVENHSRQFYGGFLGPVSAGRLDLYVNIRCMSLYPGYCTLFAGGGLTRLSELNSEWRETVAKSRTLLSVISR